MSFRFSVVINNDYILKQGLVLLKTESWAVSSITDNMKREEKKQIHINKTNWPLRPFQFCYMRNASVKIALTCSNKTAIAR